MKTTNGDSSESRLECPICLLKLKDPVLITGCLHMYCKQCIDMWKTLSSDCPMCRAAIGEVKRSAVISEIIEYSAEMEEKSILEQERADMLKGELASMALMLKELKESHEKEMKEKDRRILSAESKLNHFNENLKQALPEPEN